jgi:MFS family permease
MWPFDLPKEKLDRVGPYGSGLGSLIGSILFLGSIFIQSTPVILIFPLLVPVLSYFFCTCTHRKYRFISPAAFAGAIGSILGAVFAGGVGLIIGMATFGYGWPVAFILMGVIMFYTPFYMSRYVCNIYKNKEHPVLPMQVQSYMSVYGTLPPSSYSERMHGSDIKVPSKPRQGGPIGMALFISSTIIPLGIGIQGVHLGPQVGLVWVALIGWGLGILTSRSNGIWFGAIIGMGFGAVAGAIIFLATGWSYVEAELFSGALIGGNIGVFIGGVIHWVLQKRATPNPE